MNFLKSRKNIIGIISFIIAIDVISFFDIVLAIGFVFVGFLIAITCLIFSKAKIGSKNIYLLFFIAFLIHLSVVLFIYYSNFQPFGGNYGDYILCQQQAEEIAQRVSQGNFSLGGLSISHYYPVVIGYIYALTLPEMLIGQLFSVWLAAISVILVYLIIIKIEGSKKSAFLIGLITAIYPSYLLFGSLLLKDSLVIPLVLAGLLLTLKLIKNFSWKNFIIFYLTLGVLIHFRFYVAYALLFTFIFCWLLLSKFNFKKKFNYGIVIIFLLGFLPQFFGYGYYGIKTMKNYLTPEKITFYREVAYSPTPVFLKPSTVAPENFTEKIFVKIFPKIKKELNNPGTNSTVKMNNKAQSFTSVALGPFPSQIQSYKQLFILLETFPWYFLLFFIIRGAFVALKRQRIALPLLVFSIISLGVLALFIPNFGIITRIRIPSFIALLCLSSLGFKELKYFKIPFLNKINRFKIKTINKNL